MAVLSIVEGRPGNISLRLTKNNKTLPKLNKLSKEMHAANKI